MILVEWKRLSYVSMDLYVFYLSVWLDIEVYIRGFVEVIGGEISVVVCGGLSFVVRIRNCVVSLLDEWVVYKGIGV